MEDAPTRSGAGLFPVAAGAESGGSGAPARTAAPAADLEGGMGTAKSSRSGTSARGVLQRCRTLAIRYMSSKVCYCVRFAACLSVTFVAWFALYQELLLKDTTPFHVGETVEPYEYLYIYSLAVSFCLVVGDLLFINAVIRQYGRALVSKKFIWLSLFSIIAVFLLQLVLQFFESSHLYWLVPILCCVHLYAFSRLNGYFRVICATGKRLYESSLDSWMVRNGIQQVLGLSESEKDTLQKLIDEIDAPVLPESRGRQLARVRTGEPKMWDYEDFRLFLREGQDTLALNHGMDRTAADTLLLRVVDRVLGGAAQTAGCSYSLKQAALRGFYFLSRCGARDAILYFATILVDALLVPTQSLVVGTIADEGVKRNVESTVIAIGVYISLIAVGAAVEIVRCALAAKVISNSLKHMQMLVAERMCEMDASDHDTYSKSLTCALFTSDMARVETLLKATIASLAGPAVKLIVMLCYVLYESPTVGIVSATMLPFVFLTIPERKPSSASAAKAKSTAESLEVYQNGVDCQQMIWTSGSQAKWLQESLEPALETQRFHLSSSFFWSNIVSCYVVKLVQLYVGVQVALLGFELAMGVLTIREFTTLLNLFDKAGTPASKLGTFAKQTSSSAGSMQRIDEFLERKAKRRSCAFTDGSADVPAGVQGGDLILENVGFQNPGSRKPALDNVSLRIRAGTVAAVVGSSSSGTPTMMNLLSNWILPSAGSLRLGDGGDSLIRAGSPDDAAALAFRRKVALLSGESCLLRGSLRYNIAFGSAGEVSEDEIKQAASIAGCLTFINELAQGFDTEICGKGSPKVSLEQLRRLALARAILRKPALLLLDDFFAGLDADVEEDLVKTVCSLRSSLPESLGSLIVVASMKPNAGNLKLHDVIIHMHDGRLAKVEYPPEQRILRAL